MSIPAIREELAILRGRQAEDEKNIRGLRVQMQIHGKTKDGGLGERMLDWCDRRHADSKELGQLLKEFEECDW